MVLSFWRRKSAPAVDRRQDREPAPTAAALMQPLPADFVRLIFLGDLSSANHRGPPLIDPAIVSVFRSADLVIANCDSPVVSRPYLPMRSWLRQRRHMTAGTLLGVIAAMGIDTERLILSVANDSMLDQSAAGFEETLDTLDRLRIRVIGAARRGLVQAIEVGELKIGLVAFSEWRSGPRRRFRRRVLMTEDVPEMDWFAGDEERPDLLCVFPHWGREGTAAPGPRTRGRAAKLVRRGVSLIAGHHQRRVQPVERIGAAHVAYGLGIFHGPATVGGIARRVGGMLVVDVGVAPGERGAVAAYELFPFARLAERNRERIVPVDTLPEAMKTEAQKLLDSLDP
jgi:poly-gamma-glutamate capsule biosynthesis protein CapA/YwtB (metallophosphatase superfamily)